MKQKKDSPRCKICNHPDREGIEMLGVISCASWGVCARRINETYGTNFTRDCVKKHMTEHLLHETSVEAGVIIDGLTDGDTPRISVESMLQTIFIQGFSDLAKGKIRCKNVNDLLSVISVMNNLQRSKEAKMAMENGDMQGYWAAMAAYSEAIKDTVTPGQLNDIVTKANALGAAFNIGNVQLEHPIDIQAVDMSRAVEDYKRLGRGRTRKELIDAGVIDVQFDGLDLPEGESEDETE